MAVDLDGESFVISPAIPGRWRVRPNTARLLGLAAFGCGTWLSCSTAAEAQGALPATGPDMRIGDLSTEFQQAFGELPTPQANAWTYGASIDVSETFNDGVRKPNGRFDSDLITEVTPGFSVSGEAARLTGDFYYSPSIIIYTPDSHQNSIAQNLNADATATIVQDLFYIDLRGYAAVQPLYGGLGAAGTTAPGGQNQVQTADFSITPRLQHKFDGTGTAILSDTLSRSLASGVNTTVATTGLAAGTYTSNQENASFTTGEDFGRIQDTATATAMQYIGTGVLSKAHRETFQDSASYAISRVVAINAAIGHENIVYGTGGPGAINDVTWSVGTELTPSPDTDISLSYGHQQGFTSAQLNSSFAPTARTRVYARYSQGVSTQQEALQAAIQNSIVGPGGIPLDPITHAPLLLTNNFFPLQAVVYHTTTASVGGVLLYDRDTYTVDIEYSNNAQLSATGVSNIGNFSGTYGSIAWSHNLSDDLTTNAYFQYGVQQNSSGSQNDLTFSLSVHYLVSQTLSASAQYSRVQNGGAGAASFGQAPTADILTVSLHKTF